MTKSTAALARRVRAGLSLFLSLGVVFAVLATLGAPASAQDVDALARRAGTELRSAERSMFAGKLEDALQQLEAVDRLVEQVRAADPSHKDLAILDSKRAKLQRDLARRKGGPPPAEEPQPGAQDKPLPAPVQKRLRGADEALTQVRACIDGDAATDAEARLRTARSCVETAREQLADIEARFGRQVPKDHADLVAVRARITAADEEVAAFAERVATQAAGVADAAATEASPTADRAKVEELYERFADALDLVHGNSMVYGSRLQDAQLAYEQLEAVERDVLPTLQPALARLVACYGQKAMEIDRKLGEMGVPTHERFANKMERLIEGVEHVDASKVESAAVIARNAESSLGMVDRLGPEIRVKRMQDCKAMLQIGQKLDPNNAGINDLLSGLDARIAAVAGAVEEEIDAAVWAGNVADFAGPGEAEALAAKALEYFRAHPNWKGRPEREVEVIASAVRGGWKVADRDIFGRVIRWRLPIHLAVTDVADRERDVARVYELSVLAEEGSPERAAKAPPFDGYWVGDSWLIRLGRL